VLDVLGRHGILATFFVLGSKLAQPVRRQLAERARAEGHWIGNHTMSHATPLGLTRPGVARHEILGAQAMIAGLAHEERFFRPFGGGGALGRHLLNAEAVEVLRAEKMSCVLWNAIPRDFADPEGWVDTALAQCAAQPWSLMVLHDLPNGAMDGLEQFLEEATRRGARFRQEFPQECVPIRRGKPVLDLDAYVTGLTPL
jgi:peptidoglycan/xylan/chitin deacetylase (PgdA/CDA1 family)